MSGPALAERLAEIVHDRSRGSMEIARLLLEEVARALATAIEISLFLIITVLAGSTVIVSAPPAPPGSPIRQLQDNPIVRSIGEFFRDIGSQIDDSFNMATMRDTQVGMGATIGYTGTDGRSYVFNSWSASGVVMSGIAVNEPMSLRVKPDKRDLPPLKLYDRDTGFEGRVWFQPVVSVSIMNGTPSDYKFKVTSKAVMKCGNSPPEILSYTVNEKVGKGSAPRRMEFQKSTVGGRAVFERLRANQPCTLFLMADYDGEVLFEGDDQPVRKSLSNVVLGKFNAEWGLRVLSIFKRHG